MEHLQYDIMLKVNKNKTFPAGLGIPQNVQKFETHKWILESVCRS